QAAARGLCPTPALHHPAEEGRAGGQHCPVARELGLLLGPRHLPHQTGVGQVASCNEAPEVVRQGVGHPELLTEAQKGRQGPPVPRHTQLPRVQVAQQVTKQVHSHTRNVHLHHH
ncbi:unnamed protein product, partial [Ixodes pacificus]